MKRIVPASASLLFAGCVLLAPSTSQAVVQTQPATNENVQSLQATITGIEGFVQVRASHDQPWTKAEVGMKLDENAEFRTSIKSAVQFEMPGNQVVTLDRLGTVRLAEAVNDNGKFKTQLQMKYGRTRFDIEATDRPHEASISSPSSTLAVRGTKVSLFDQRPFPAEAVSLTGRADFRDGKKEILFGNAGQGKTTVNVNQQSTASLALVQSTLDPSIALARSDAEAPLVQRLISNGSSVFFDRDAGIKVVTGGVPPTDPQLIPTLPGVLDIVARWHTDADLNLSLSTPGGKNNQGQLLYPIGALATNSTGGVVAFDHRGGPNGGIEIIYFPALPPDGLYAIGLTLIRGDTTRAQVDAFENGKRVGIFNGQSTVNSITVDVTKPIPGFVDGTAVGVLPVGFSFPFSEPAAKSGSSSSTVKSSAPISNTPAKISQITAPTVTAKQKR